MKYAEWIKSGKDDVTPPSKEGWLEKLYRKIWTKIGGRPWTWITKDSWHSRSFIWFCILLFGSGVIGAKWKVILTFIATHFFFWY